MAGSKCPIIEERKDLAMRNQRSFSLEFKRQVVEELLSGESRPAQLCRRHNISPSVLSHWKRQYSRGKFDNEPIEEAALKDRIEKLANAHKLALNKQAIEILRDNLNFNLDNATDQDWRQIFEALGLKMLAFGDGNYDIEVNIPVEDMQIETRTPWYISP